MPQHSEAQARLVVDDEFRVGPVHDRVFGSFVEHLGRCVYTGIYEPWHPTADAEGFRQDVIDLVKELGGQNTAKKFRVISIQNFSSAALNGCFVSMVVIAVS